MKRIKGMDALMYYSENEHASQQVLGLMVLDPATCPGGRFDREAFEALLLSRFEHVDMFRKKFVKAPMDMAFPAMVDDPSFRLQNHIRHIALPRPGSHQQLADILSSIASVPLNMKRPLWEMTLIDGYDNGRYSVIVTKTHHCMMDAAGGAQMMTRLLSEKPDPPPDLSDVHSTWEPDSPSLLGKWWSDLQDARSTYSGVVKTLGAVGVTLAGKTVYSVGSQLGVLPKPEAGKRRPAKVSVLQREMPDPVPRLYFNRAVTSPRCVAFGEFPEAGVDEIRRILGLTFNDVVLGICTLALRRFLLEHDALPHSNIVVSMPISTRGELNSEGLNQLRIVSTPLPIRIADPVAALKRTGAIMNEIKARYAGLDTGGIKFTRLVTPQLGAMLGRLYNVEGLADYVRILKSNAAISTMAGPPSQLYFGAAKVVSISPVGPLADGVGLTICALTYQGVVNFTVNGCPDFLPDVQSVGEQIRQGYDDALAAARKLARGRPAPKSGRSRGKSAAAKTTKNSAKTTRKISGGRRRQGV